MWSLGYNTFFIARRFLFLMIFLPYNGPITFEILAVLYLNLSSLIYIGSNWALNRRLYNRLDFFDEYWIAILSLHLVLFTDYVGDVSVIHGYGWLMIALMIFNLLVKLIVITVENFYRIRMIWLHYLRPFWLRYLKPYWDNYVMPLFKLCKKPEKIIVKNELDVATDENGFSSNYIII